MAEVKLRAFVCGHPIAHSRSPLIHGYWLKTLGLEGTYERIDVAPADFATFMASFAGQGFVGGNVTIPHKEAACRLVARRDGAAEAIGAVNTLWRQDGVLHGGNTDALGFAANLDEYEPEWRLGRAAVMLGAGGAARAVVHALKESGYRDIAIVNRTLARARELADRFGPAVSAHGWDALPDLLSHADLVVNTTPLGMEGESTEVTDLTPASERAIVTDLVYVPLETPFLRAARLRGLRTVDGLGMLLHQAVPGFERWFGVRPAVTPALRELVIADLARRR